MRDNRRVTFDCRNAEKLIEVHCDHGADRHPGKVQARDWCSSLRLSRSILSSMHAYVLKDVIVC